MKNTKKKVLALILAFSLVLTSCGLFDSKEKASDNKEKTEESVNNNEANTATNNAGDTVTNQEGGNGESTVENESDKPEDKEAKNATESNDPAKSTDLDDKNNPKSDTTIKDDSNDSSSIDSNSTKSTNANESSVSNSNDSTKSANDSTSKAGTSDSSISTGSSKNNSGTKKPSNTESSKGSDSKKEPSKIDSGSSSGSTGSGTSVSKLKIGQTVKISSTVKVYTNASDAKNKTNSVSTYPAGTYSIYKIVDGVVNLTRNKGEAGGWINPSTVTIKVTSDAPNDTSDNSTPSKPDDSDGSLSKTAYSWSWKYPGAAGKLLSRYNGYYKMFGSNKIYLTFDNGYEYQNLTADILDTLKAKNVKSVFFVTSDYLYSASSLVRRMVREGHIVANHSVNHLDHTKSTYKQIYNDIKGWESDYRKVVGASPSVKLFRPPAGTFNETSLKIARDLGYKTLLWSYAYLDWDTSNQPSKSSALNKLISNNSGGNILLLHSVSRTNANILGEYINKTRAQGYSFAQFR